MNDKYVHVCVGNLNLDLTLYVPRLPGFDESVIAYDMLAGPGGSASNYASAVACYGHKPVLIASAASNPMVDKILDEIRDRGVIIDYVKRVEGDLGLVVVIVTRNGEKVMFKYRGANELLSPNDVPRELLDQASIVHLASIPSNIAGEIARRASKLGILVSYDPGAYATIEKERIIEMLDRIDILFLNRVEAKNLAGSNIESLLKYGVSILVIKKGAGGAYVVQHGGFYYYGRSKPISKPVNTTGAGDAFDAYFNAAYLDYKDIGKALSYGLAAGALQTMCKTSIMCCNEELFKKQLLNTTVEIVKEPDEWILED